MGVVCNTDFMQNWELTQPHLYQIHLIPIVSHIVYVLYALSANGIGKGVERQSQGVAPAAKYAAIQLGSG